jgi:hypothetical protein
LSRPLGLDFVISSLLNLLLIYTPASHSLMPSRLTHTHTDSSSEKYSPSLMQLLLAKRSICLFRSLYLLLTTCPSKCANYDPLVHKSPSRPHTVLSLRFIKNPNLISTILTKPQYWYSEIMVRIANWQGTLGTPCNSHDTIRPYNGSNKYRNISASGAFISFQLLC